MNEEQEILPIGYWQQQHSGGQASSGSQYGGKGACLNSCGFGLIFYMCSGQLGTIRFIKIEHGGYVFAATQFVISDFTEKYREKV